MPKPLQLKKPTNPNSTNGHSLPIWQRDSQNVYNRLMTRYVEPPAEWLEPTEKTIEEVVEPLECKTFEDLVATIKKQKLHWTQLLEDTLACMLAVIVSTRNPCDQLWMRVIGPPGSGKSTLESCVSAAKDYVYSLDVFKGIMSGYRSADGKDNSLVPRIQGKCVMVSDGDTLMSSPARDKILSELRRMYDKKLHGDYLNSVEHHHDNIETTFILCGTDGLRALDKSSLGERFLNCEIFGDGDHEPYIDRSIKNTYSRLRAHLTNATDIEQPPDFTEIKQRSVGFLQYLIEDKLINKTFNYPEFPPETEAQIKSLGRFLSHVRARRIDPQEATYRSRNELATRITAQLTKLGVFLAIVLDQDTIALDAIRILRSVAIASGEGFHMEIVRELQTRTEGLDTRQLGAVLRLSHTRVRNILEEMQDFKLVERDERPNNSGARGRNRHVWILTEFMRELYTHAVSE